MKFNCEFIQFCNKKNKPTRLLLAEAIALVIAGGFSMNAMAQQANAQKAEEVVVTGSLIRGVTPTGSPVVGLSSKDIQDGGFFNATEVLRSLPQVLNLGYTDSQSFTGSSVGLANPTSANAINLRGLGTASTLTLVNGHRSASSGTTGAVFDPSNIPSLAIGRMEVLVDGTSALYGSDAVAGVVNVRLKTGVDGASSQASIGGGHGVRQWSASQLFGKTWDTGNLTATVEHTYRNNVYATELPQFYDSNFADYGLVQPAGSNTFGNNPGNIRVTSGTYGGVACSTAAPCYFAIPNQNGLALTGASLPTVPGAAANNYAGANQRNLFKDYTLVPQQKRNTLVLTGEQELGERVKVSGEVLSSKRTFVRYGPQVNTNLTIPNSNPYSPCNLSKTNRPAYCGPLATSTLTVPYYFGSELGPSINSGYNKLNTASGAVEVDLSHEWRGELSGTYSRNQEDRLTVNSINTYSGNKDSYGYTGSLSDPTIFVNNFNPFIGDGTVSAQNQALADKIRAYNDLNITYTLKNVAARFDGPLFNLPGGELKAAFGFEHRQDEYTRTQTGTQLGGTGGVTLTGVALGLSVNAQDVKTLNPLPGKRTVNAQYVEFFVPVVGKNNAIPFVQKFDLSLAGRHEMNSQYGSSRTPKVGFTWAVNDDFQFNGTVGRSFRAPGFAESDSYQSTPTGYSNNGLPNIQNFLYFNGRALNTNETVLLVGGGNPNLKPETARTKTLGFSFHPKAIPGFDVTVGYYDIKYTNRISSSSAFNQRTTVLSDPIWAPYILAGSATQLPTAAEVAYWQNYIASQTAGQSGSTPTSTVVAIVDGRISNGGVLTTNGYDISGRYAWNTAYGRLNVGLTATLINSWKVGVAASSPLSEFINTNSDAYPLRFRARGQLGWRSGPYALTGTANYTNSYTNNANVGAGLPVSAPESVASNTTVDLNAAYDFGKTGQGFLKNFRVQLNIQNLLDRDPPKVRFFPNSTTILAFDPQNASALGRQITMQVSKDW